MRHRSFLAVASVFGAAGVIALGWIPGVGVLFLVAALLVAIADRAGDRPASNQSGKPALWLGALLSLGGALIIPFLGPIFGASVFGVGIAVSVIAAIWRLLVAR